MEDWIPLLLKLYLEKIVQDYNRKLIPFAQALPLTRVHAAKARENSPLRVHSKSGDALGAGQNSRADRKLSQ